MNIQKLLVTAGDVWNYWQNIQILNILFGVLTYSMLWKTFHPRGLVSSWNVPKPLLIWCLFCPLETWSRHCTMSSRILIQVSLSICLCIHWDILLSLLASTFWLLGVECLIVRLCSCRMPLINVPYKRTFGTPDQGQMLDVWESQTAESALRDDWPRNVPPHTLEDVLEVALEVILEHMCAG